MIVRLRFKSGTPKRAVPPVPPEQRPALAAPPAAPPASGPAAVLTPAAALAAAVAAWRIGADLGLAHEFFVTDGLFSRWQMWLGGAVLLQVTAYLLNRRAGGRTALLPPATELHPDRHPRRGV